MKKHVYHVDVKVDTLSIRLYFPTAQVRKIFCLTHTGIVTKSGRRPLLATNDDLQRTRMNLEFYESLKDFVPVWDAFVR